MPRRMPHHAPHISEISALRVPHWSAVVLAVSSVALVVVSALVRDAVSSPVWWAVALVVGGSWWLARQRTRAVAETSANRLDERDLATRNVAAWWGQTVMFTLSAVAALMLMVLARLGTNTADLILLRCGGIVLSFVILSAAVPTFVVSLLAEPDEKLDNDDEDDA